ncbi:MAG: hypothetical protein LQ342_004976 [Letrouitia transgressa]|nr:MAG: hypothetical protein LQ342_004976 [Letrouitia transgressa]
MLHSSTTYGRNPNQGGFINPYAHVAQYGQFNQHGQFYTASNPDIRAGNTNVSADTLSQSLSGMSLRGVDCGASAKLNHAAMTNNIAGAGRMTGSQNNGSILYALPNGSFLYSNAHGGYGNYQYPASYSLNATQPSQIPQLQYSSVPVANLQTGPVTPRGQNWTTSQQLPPDLPELAAPRRSSVSSNEGESPQTPQFPAPGPGYHPSIYISNHSPTTWGPYTPSPQQLGLAGQQVAKNAQGEPIVVDFEAWTQAEPAIPDAIPAVYSPNSRGNLEQIMHNPNETTNVYVRGLHLDTTDAMLHAYGQRFGDVVSAKSIIDNATGLCKG